jgi:phosphoribosylamine--glycine ligase
MGVTGWKDTLKEAIDSTYEAVKEIRFEGMHYRRDIGAKGLKIRRK